MITCKGRDINYTGEWRRTIELEIHDSLIKITILQHLKVINLIFQSSQVFPSFKSGFYVDQSRFSV